MAINFEKLHKQFNGMMFKLCQQCGGTCEQNEITVFLPGEVNFCANKLNIPVKEFIKKFCNTVLFQEHEIYILKAGMCPFLKHFRCDLQNFNCKLIHCMLYPVLIGLKNRQVEIYVDHCNCPMADKITPEFKDKAFAIYQEIVKEIPMWWMEFISTCDSAVYDYQKMSKLRYRKHIKVQQLIACQVR